VPVKKGDRIADVDPRGSTDDLDHISDKSLRVADGVLEAVLGLLAEFSHVGSKAKAQGAAARKKKAPAKGATRAGKKSRSKTGARPAAKSRTKTAAKTSK
jgi:hypothetical protein